jgi:hypothetical protein
VTDPDDLELPRPAPSPGFRGALGRRVGAVRPPGPPPAALRALVLGLVIAGTVLLLLALTQI